MREFQYNPYADIKNLIQEHRDIMRDITNGSDRWIKHLEEELMNFWMLDDVKDMSAKLFRSFLTDDGKKLPGLNKTNEWPRAFQEAIKKDENGNYTAEAGGLLEGPDKNANYNFVRIHSRQVFAYGVAYNMTGKAEYFNLCKEGAIALMNLVEADGSMCTRLDLSGKKVDGKDDIDYIEKRTSQDLAYGMSGIAFYYYLTHDESALEKVLVLKKYIFDTYYHKGRGVVSWLPQKVKDQNKRLELVAHLDQLYAYMLWLTPSLPADYKKEFKRNMKELAHIMIERFYSEVHGTFWGASTSSDMQALGSAHTDFGHSVKTMWVIYQVGIWTKDTYLINFARQKIHAILENAFDPESGAWNRRILSDGKIDKDKEWWSLAELNQAAALLAIKDPSYLQYLNDTYAFWFENMIDAEHGEIWHVLNRRLNPKRIFPKVHCWKNGYHSLEHALIGYLTSKQILSEKIDLYYAFAPKEEVKHQTVTPYFFKANITEKEVIANGKISDVKGNPLNIVKVTFESLH